MRVFISYKWEGTHHNRWVQQLAGDLRARGIDALLDKWEVRLGQSFSDYMTEGIHSVDAMLFIMTPVSVDAAEAASGRGGAVKFEVQLATARRIAGEKFRFIGILRKGEKPVKHLRDNRYIDFRNRKKYIDVLDELVGDLIASPKKPPIPLKHSFHKVAELGVELDAHSLRAIFLKECKDIVVWEESTDESDSSPVVIYETHNGKYEPRPVTSIKYATRINVDAKNRIIATQEREGITVLDGHAVVAWLPIKVTSGDPIIRSETVHPQAPVVVFGTDYGQIIAWDFEKNKIKFSRRYFPKSEIVWINNMVICNYTNELIFCINNVIYKVRLSDGEITSKNKLGPSHDAGAIAIHEGLDFLAVGSLMSTCVYKLSTYELLFEICIGNPLVNQLTFSSDGKWLGIVFGFGTSGRGSILVETTSGEVLAKFDEISFANALSLKQLLGIGANSITLSFDRGLVGVGTGPSVVIYEFRASK